MNPERKLTLRECADILGVSVDFVRGEIIDHRMTAAFSVKRKSGRTFRKVALSDFVAYCEKYSPSALARVPAA